MHITDLRINNYVLFQNEALRIKEIMKDPSGKYFLNLDNGMKVKIHDVKPIEITEEWLQNLGFEETYRSENRVRFERPEKFLKYDIDLCLHKILEGLMLYGNYVSCVSVHHLQNLYHSLMGKEIINPDGSELKKVTA